MGSASGRAPGGALARGMWSRRVSLGRGYRSLPPTSSLKRLLPSHAVSKNMSVVCGREPDRAGRRVGTAEGLVAGNRRPDHSLDIIFRVIKTIQYSRMRSQSLPHQFPAPDRSGTATARVACPYRRDAEGHEADGRWIPQGPALPSVIFAGISAGIFAGISADLAAVPARPPAPFDWPPRLVLLLLAAPLRVDHRRRLFRLVGPRGRRGQSANRRHRAEWEVSGPAAAGIQCAGCSMKRGEKQINNHTKP